MEILQQGGSTSYLLDINHSGIQYIIKKIASLSDVTQYMYSEVLYCAAQ